ncbi:MAG: MFS transporter [Deltaproteobacteria bacterium]|jgi:Na+/melibiose symporter-like transporter|nr:MFS transporter [Deltaproteobacteria bacterium]
MNRLGMGTKLGYGIGQAAEGLKTGAFEYILFFYYVQVLGLSGTLSGAALLIAMVADAITDPLVASISDNSRSRLGRRHPFIYGSALPMALFFFVLFSPPGGLGQAGLFLWLTGFSILVRSAMTFCVIPHLALGAELTSDYHERTTIVAYRTFFLITSMSAVVPLGFWLFFSASRAYPNGQLDPSAYGPFALSLAALMFLAIAATGLGTHGQIPHLPRPDHTPERFSFGRVVLDLLESLQNLSFRWFFLGIFLYAIARGTQSALNVHMFTFFWQLSPGEIARWGTAVLIGSIIGIFAWARVARSLNKKATYVSGLLLWSACLSLPPLAYLVGWFPDPGSGLFLPLLLAFGGLAMFFKGSQITSGSMLADIADEHEVRTGRRQEGMFFGALSFSSKASSGLGHLFAGLMLDLIRFPADAVPGSVPQEALRSLAILYGPVVFLVVSMGCYAISRYSLTRQELVEIQARLRARKRAAVDQ